MDKEVAVLLVSVSGCVTEGTSIDKLVIKPARSPTVLCNWGTLALERASGTELSTGGSPEPDARRILTMRSKPADPDPQGLCDTEHKEPVGETGWFNGGDGGLEYLTIRQRVIWATN